MDNKKNVPLQLITGFLLADIISGGFHWYEDTYLDYCTDLPFLDEIAKENELHHYFPRSILAGSYLNNIETTLPIATIILVLLCLMNKNLYKKYPYFLITFFIFGVGSNIIHRFSHMRECENNDLVNLLQKTGILCSHSHHSKHHRTMNDKRYCVITEYNNYILDNIDFWRHLEHLVFICTGVKPNRKDGYDEYKDIHNYMHENAKLDCPVKPTKQDVDELRRLLKEYKGN